MVARAMYDAQKLNVPAAEGRFTCPACGLAAVFAYAPYDGFRGIIGVGICPCCLWEPGFDDDPAACGGDDKPIMQLLREYREKWVSAGSPWLEPAASRPANWSGEAQLERLLLSAPQLR
jgi:hypothetical protein